MDPEILNFALAMALEWGENFHKPIQQRLMDAHPTVTPEEADSFEVLCREMRGDAFGQIERAYLKEITDQEATAHILGKYPMVNAENLSMIWTQGQYYAWHDNG